MHDCARPAEADQCARAVFAGQGLIPSGADIVTCLDAAGLETRHGFYGYASSDATSKTTKTIAVGPKSRPFANVIPVQNAKRLTEGGRRLLAQSGEKIADHAVIVPLRPRHGRPRLTSVPHLDEIESCVR